MSNLTYLAKQPKIIESSVETLEVCNVNRYSNHTFSNEVVFKFNQAQLSQKLRLDFVFDSLYGGKFNANLSAVIFPGSDAENEVDGGRRDYFISLRFLKNRNFSGIKKWFRLSTPQGRGISNFDDRYGRWRKDDANCEKIISFGKVINYNEWDLVSNSNLEIQLKMSIIHYDSIVQDSISSQSLTQEKRMLNLLGIENQLSSTVNFHVGQNENIVVHEITLRDSGSHIFKSVLDPAFRQEDRLRYIGLPYANTQTITAFRNWVYGLNTEAMLPDFQFNLALLEFVDEFMICDLIQFCFNNIFDLLKTNFSLALQYQIWNRRFPILTNPQDPLLQKAIREQVIKLFENEFTIELLIEVWKFNEEHRIPGLKECVRDWIKNKSEGQLQGCLPWK